jgi:hypothetical protein
VPGDWTDSEVAAHLRGIAKLVGRAKESLLRGLERELVRVEQELVRLGAEGEEWAAAWRKRRAPFERIWGEMEDRATQFLDQTTALRAWLPLNDRLASLAALGAKVGKSDPALARSVAELTSELRQRFATDSWMPVHAHQEVAARLATLEAQAQGLLFSRVQAYLGELDVLRVRFDELLSGPAPLIDMATQDHAGGADGPPFARLYAWATQNFAEAAQRFRARRAGGQAWRHPTRKSQGWSDIDGQLSRALASARSSAKISAVIRLGELLLLVRQGFFVAAAERGEVVYEGAESASDLPELSSLLADGRVRVRVEWIRTS